MIDLELISKKCDDIIADLEEIEEINDVNEIKEIVNESIKKLHKIIAMLNN